MQGFSGKLDNPTRCIDSATNQSAEPILDHSTARRSPTQLVQLSEALPLACKRMEMRLSSTRADSEPPSDLSETEFLALLVKLEQGLRAFARVLVPDWDLVDESLQEASVTMW